MRWFLRPAIDAVAQERCMKEDIILWPEQEMRSWSSRMFQHSSAIPAARLSTLWRYKERSMWSWRNSLQDDCWQSLWRRGRSYVRFRQMWSRTNGCHMLNWIHAILIIRPPLTLRIQSIRMQRNGYLRTDYIFFELIVRSIFEWWTSLACNRRDIFGKETRQVKQYKVHWI